MDDRERQKLTKRLKSVKTAEERDRILWILAGQDKTSRGKSYRPEPLGRPAATGPAPTPSPTPAPGPDDRLRKLPIGKWGGFGSVPALLFFFYGIVSVGSALLRLVQGESDGEETRQFISGGMFLVIGVVLYMKAKRRQQQTDENA